MLSIAKDLFLTGFQRYKKTLKTGQCQIIIKFFSETSIKKLLLTNHTYIKLTCGHNQLRETSADNKPYKKALCMNIITTGFCFYGSRCADAHSEIELRWFERMEADQLELKEKLKDLESKFWQRMEGVKSSTGVHPDANNNSFFYKTSMCKFASSGVCAWGSGCWYAHSELELRSGH